MNVQVSTAERRLTAGPLSAGCAIGRGGACPAGAKREGDGRTPIGLWPIRGVLIRPDRAVLPPTGLPWRWTRPTDGWSDDPRDPAYNRPVRRPHPLSAERMWRDDHAYDIVVLLGHNDAPPVPAAGSAIFLHLANGPVTEGCVAIDRTTMDALLPMLSLGDGVMIA